MANLSDIFLLLRQIREDLPALVERSKINPKQVVTVTGLSDITERMGLIQAGEFRTGNSVEPGFGFSGVRIGYPAFSYNDELWNIAGVENDKLQFGVRASDGKALAGGGAVTLDEDGISVNDGGDSIVFKESVFKQYGLLTLRQNVATPLSRLHFRTFKVTTETNQISNGDFETGDLTDWTETDPSNNIDVIYDGESSVLSFDSAHYSTDYIQQNLAATATNGIVVTFRARVETGSSNYGVLITTDAGTELSSLSGSEWRNYYVVISGSATYVRIGIADFMSVVYIDDIVVRPLYNASNAFLDISTTGVTIAGDTVIEDTIGIGGTVETGYAAKVHGKVNLTTGNTYDINGTPHTHTGLVTNGDSHDHNGGDGAAITDANLSTSDITTNDASTTKHGFLKKLSNVATEFMNGQGNWATPAGGSTAEFGAKTVWDSATGYHVEAGVRAVNGSTLTWTSSITRSSLSLSADTFYYVYLYDNSGTPAVEESTTAPTLNSSAKPYWQKTADATRRFICAFRTDASSNIYRFLVEPVGDNTFEFFWTPETGFTAAPFLIINAGSTSGSWATVDLTGMCPSIATHWYCSAKMLHPVDGNEAVLGISPLDLSTQVGSGALFTVRASAGRGTNSRTFFGRNWCPIQTSLTNYYRIQQVNGTNTVDIEIQGFKYNI